MGKVQRQRKKYHVSSSGNKTSQHKYGTKDNSNLSSHFPLSVDDNIFSGVNISFNSLKRSVNEDTRSVASFKSVKSELGANHISKKDKIKLRRNMLLKKIDLINQMKKENEIRKKRKNNVIMGDTNALHDALPSIEHLFNSKGTKLKVPESGKKKPIAKASKRKKAAVQGVNIFRKLLSNKQLQKDPMNVIKEHVKQRVESGVL